MLKSQEGLLVTDFCLTFAVEKQVKPVQDMEEKELMVPLSKVLSWFDETFENMETEDWYHGKNTESVVAQYTTKEELRKRLIHEMKANN